MTIAADIEGSSPPPAAPGEAWAQETFLRRLRVFRLICAAWSWFVPACALLLTVAIASDSREHGFEIVFVIIGSFVILALVALASFPIFLPLIAVARYRVRSMLRARHGKLPGRVLEAYTWDAPDPGSVALMATSTLVLVTGNWNYDECLIAPGQIVAAKVEVRQTQFTDTRHGGSLSVGRVFGSRWFGSYSFGSKSSSVTRSVDNALLEIQAQPQPGQPIATFVVPFGGDRRAAEQLCLLVNQFRAAA